MQVDNVAIEYPTLYIGGSIADKAENPNKEDSRA